MAYVGIWMKDQRKEQGKKERDGDNIYTQLGHYAMSSLGRLFGKNTIHEPSLGKVIQQAIKTLVDRAYFILFMFRGSFGGGRRRIRENITFK